MDTGFIIIIISIAFIAIVMKLIVEFRMNKNKRKKDDLEQILQQKLYNMQSYYIEIQSQENPLEKYNHEVKVIDLEQKRREKSRMTEKKFKKYSQFK